MPSSFEPNAFCYTSRLVILGKVYEPGILGPPGRPDSPAGDGLLGHVLPALLDLGAALCELPLLLVLLLHLLLDVLDGGRHGGLVGAHVRRQVVRVRPRRLQELGPLQEEVQLLEPGMRWILIVIGCTILPYPPDGARIV